MAQQNINIGTAPNDGTGDPLRTSFDKTHQTFTELYDFTNGFKDYNDQTGSVSLTANTWTDIPNNGLAAFTNKVSPSYS